MNYRIVNLNTSAGEDPDSSILIIYTGGTFGMAYDNTGSLVPFNFGRVLERIPELKSLDLKLTVISFPEPVDSSNVNSQNITAANKNNSGSHEDDLLEREADKSTEYYCSIDYIPHVPTISTGM